MAHLYFCNIPPRRGEALARCRVSLGLSGVTDSAACFTCADWIDPPRRNLSQDQAIAGIIEEESRNPEPEDLIAERRKDE